jgi:hypothetical protein
LLYQAEELGYTWYLQKLGQDLDGAVDFFVPALFPIVITACLLYAAILFDTFGDELGAKQAIYPAIFMLLLPILIWLLKRIDWSRFQCKERVVKQKQKSIVRSLSDNGGANMDGVVHVTDLSAEGVEMRETIIRSTTSSRTSIFSNTDSIADNPMHQKHVGSSVSRRNTGTSARMD